jgi:hypothetical protein
MRKIGFLASSLALILILVTGCTFFADKKPTVDPKPIEKPTVEEEKKTPLQVLKETQKVIPTIKAYKFTRTTLERGTSSQQQSYTNTESGVEQLNPEIAHFTNSRNTEYYYDKQNIYMKKDGQWTKRVNLDGKVLVSVLFTNNVDFIIKNLGTKDELPGITVTKKDDEYIVSVDYLIFKDPQMTDADFAKSKAETAKRKTELVIDANTYEPKKYVFNYESKDGTKLRSIDMDLSTYTSTIVIPSEALNATQSSTQTQQKPTTTY